MARPDWTLPLVKKIFPRDPKRNKVTQLPGVDRAIERLLFEGDRILCLPNDKVIHLGERLEPPESLVAPSRLVEHFIEKTDIHVLLDFCVCRESMGCKDHPHDLGCLFMGEAALGINPKWGKRVTRRQALEHVRRSQEAGLVHFMGRSKLDTVWLGIGPGEKLLTVCSCCPCCCITRGLPYMTTRVTEKVQKAPGVEVEVTDRCIGCGSCADGTCFVHALHVEGGRARISNECRGCGRCVEACPEGAIEISIDVQRFMGESVDRISRVVDVT